MGSFAGDNENSDGDSILDYDNSDAASMFDMDEENRDGRIADRMTEDSTEIVLIFSFHLSVCVCVCVCD